MTKLPKEKPILAECGDLGFKRYSGLVHEEFLLELTGTSGVKKFREMADNDPIIGASLWLMESLLRPVAWTMEPNESGAPGSTYVADRVDEAINDMKSKWGVVIARFLTALIFGWVYIEPTYKIRRGQNKSKLFNSKHDDGLFGWRDMGIRAQESFFRWEFDESGEVMGMWQRPPHDYRDRFIPIDRALHYKLRDRKGNPEGYSLLRVPTTSYNYATRHREIASIGVERCIAGLPDMQLPSSIMSPGATADEKLVRAKYEQMVQKVRAGAQYGGIVRPAEREGDRDTGYVFKLISASGKNFGEALDFVKHYESRIAICFFTQFFTLGSDKHGSHAMHSDMTSNLGQALGTVNDSIAEIVNDEAIPRLCELNGWGSELIPYYKPGDIEKQKLTEVGAFVSQMVSSGAMENAPDLNNWGRSQIDLPPMDPGINSILESTPESTPLNQPPEVPIEAAEDDVAEELPEFMDAQEASDMIGASRGTINRAVAKGQLPGAKVGNTYRIRRQDLLDWFKASAPMQ